MRSLADVGAAWRARPGSYTRPVWALILALDALPWPWGEELLAWGFVARAFVRVARLRQALAWAGAHAPTPRARWALARTLCAQHGRFAARSALVGVRDPQALARHVVVRGGEHVGAAGRGVIFLGFHLGPANSYLALRVAGHGLTWIGAPGASTAWPRAIVERFQAGRGDLLLPGGDHAWERRLYRARLVLREGGHVFISGDGAGTEAFSVPVLGGAVPIGAGSMFLRRSTGAPVLPVLSHLEGRVQMVTIHPALPPALDDPAHDRLACRHALEGVLGEHVRRHPEQCYSLAFGLPPSPP